MTVNQLIKKLEKLQAKYGKRLKVCVNTKSLLDDSNGVFEIAHINDVEAESIEICDGDGFKEYDSKGYEKTSFCAVIK